MCIRDRLEGSAAVLPEEGAALAPYFTVEMPPVMGVMSALVLAFVLGLGMAYLLSLIHILFSSPCFTALPAFWQSRSSRGVCDISPHSRCLKRL